MIWSRGEQFRHAQNVLSKQDRTGRRTVAFDYNRPSLPLSQLFGGSDASAGEDIAPIQPAPFRDPGQPGHAGALAHPPVTLVEGVPTYAYPNGAVPGPRPPRSWGPLFRSGNSPEYETAWRAHALALFLAHGPSPPSYLPAPGPAPVQPLTLACLRVVLAACEDPEDLAAAVLYVPAQLRRELMRWCAVHAPLDTARLRALCAGDGHAAGELIVVGPQGTFRTDIFAPAHAHIKGRAQGPDPADMREGESESVGREEHWDAPHVFDTPLALTALAVVSASVSNSALLSLPRTLTRLALLNLPQRMPIHNLTRTCPYLEILDLSFNPWLKTDDNTPGTSTLEFSSLNRVEWRRWRNLRVLGLRECGLGRDVLARINEGRWVDYMQDIEVVGLDNDPQLALPTTVDSDIQL